LHFFGGQTTYPAVYQTHRGAAIIWIAIKLLTEGAKEECQNRECGSIWQALWVIIVADLSMGIDNMLAVGAASHGNMSYSSLGLPYPYPSWSS